jgi:hypothetical protein
MTHCIWRARLFCDRRHFRILLVSLCGVPSTNAGEVCRRCGEDEPNGDGTNTTDSPLRARPSAAGIGVVRKVYTKVKPDGHDQALLEDIRSLSEAAPGDTRNIEG